VRVILITVNITEDRADGTTINMEARCHGSN